MDKQHEAFKSAKQRLSAIPIVIKKDTKNGQIPRLEDVNRFVAESNEMNRLCQTEWRTAMDEYMVRLGNFQAAIKQKERQAIKAAFQRLLDCKVHCHKKFRQK